MRRSHIYSKRIYYKYMKYLTQTTDVTSEKIKDLDYGRVVLDTTTGSVYILGYGIKYQTVDLGLTSGTLWMDRNVGAEEITDNGLYFAWGETQGYTAEEIGVSRQFDIDEYKYYDSSSNSYTKYNGSDGDGLTTLEETDDAAFQTTHKFYVPTIEQCVELFMETDVYFIKADGTEIHGTWDDEQLYVMGGEKPIEDYYRGIEFRKKSDNSIKLFVPNNGAFIDGKFDGVGVLGSYMTNYMYNINNAWSFMNEFNICGVIPLVKKCYGYSVRGVVAASTNVSDAVAEVVETIIGRYVMQ